MELEIYGMTTGDFVIFSSDYLFICIDALRFLENEEICGRLNDLYFKIFG
jgi:hypothetical protein